MLKISFLKFVCVKSEDISFVFFVMVYVCMLTCKCANTCACMCKHIVAKHGEHRRTFWNPQFFLCLVWVRDQTGGQVGSKHLYLLSDLTSLHFFFFSTLIFQKVCIAIEIVSTFLYMYPRCLLFIHCLPVVLKAPREFQSLRDDCENLRKELLLFMS